MRDELFERKIVSFALVIVTAIRMSILACKKHGFPQRNFQVAVGTCPVVFLSWRLCSGHAVSSSVLCKKFFSTSAASDKFLSLPLL